MPTYNQGNDPATNISKLIKEQNTAGSTAGQFEGAEPYDVLIAKAVFNAATSSGSTGSVDSVNGRVGTVVVTKTDVGLSNVPNVDATNASNLSSGTVPVARLPAQTGDVTSPAGSAVNTLATVNSTVGSFGSASLVPVITVNAKGLVTSVSTVAVAGGGGGGSGDVTLTGTQTLTNKTLTAPVINGTITGSYTLGGSPVFPVTVITTTASQTLTNKTIISPSGIVKGDVGLSNVDNTSNATERVATATLANKTLSAPVFSGTVTGTYTLGGTPTFPAAVVTLTGTQTLTNKTLTSPAITTPTGIVKGDVGLGNVDNTSNATERATTATLTNKTIAYASNTLTGVQPLLTSGTNIKTINGTTILGSGDITVSGTGDVTAAASFGTDNVLIRSNGTGKGVQATGIIVDDDDNMTIADLTLSGSLDMSGATVSGFWPSANVATTLVSKKLTLTASHGTDDTYDGTQITGLNAGGTIAQWEAVYLGGSSTWLLADANGSGTYPARGLAVAAYVNTNPATILVTGTVRNDAWAWTPGGTLYLSGTAGAITQTAPSTSGDNVQRVGFALTADIAYFDFDSSFTTVA